MFGEIDVARIKFMNIEVDNLTIGEALETIDQLVQENRNAYVVTPNVDHIVQVEQGGEFREIYENADLILADGKPLLWISKWYGTPIKQKVSGSDLFPLLCGRAAKRGYKMFFLGAAEGVAAQAAENLTKRYPGLQVVGTYSPPYGFEQDAVELEKIEKTITDKKPQILIVGLGCPKQELFIWNNKERLNVPISLGLGASLDFEAGNVKRAPKWMSECGLEWAYRIMQDPKRLIKRYLINDMKIFRLIWKYRRH